MSFTDFEISATDSSMTDVASPNDTDSSGNRPTVGGPRAAVVRQGTHRDSGSPGQGMSSFSVIVPGTTRLPSPAPATAQDRNHSYGPASGRSPRRPSPAPTSRSPMAFKAAALTDSTPTGDPRVAAGAAGIAPMAPPSHPPPGSVPLLDSPAGGAVSCFPAAAASWQSITMTLQRAAGWVPQASVGDAMAMQRATELANYERVNLMNQYVASQRATQHIDSMRDALRGQYVTEVQAANEKARKCHEEAVTNGRYAQTYANATFQIGQQALAELQERDYRLLEQQAMSSAYEQLAQTWEQNAAVVYNEASTKINEDLKCLGHTEAQMQTFKMNSIVQNASLNMKAPHALHFNNFNSCFPKRRRTSTLWDRRCRPREIRTYSYASRLRGLKRRTLT